MYRALFKRLLHGKSAAGKHGEHRSVLRKHFRLELRHTFFLSDMNQVSQDAACDSLTLVVFFHGEGNFSTAQRVWRGVQNIASRSDDGFISPSSRNRDHQRDGVFKINLGDSLELSIGELALVAKKTGVDGFTTRDS